MATLHEVNVGADGRRVYRNHCRRCQERANEVQGDERPREGPEGLGVAGRAVLQYGLWRAIVNYQVANESRGRVRERKCRRTAWASWVRIPTASAKCLTLEVAHDTNEVRNEMKKYWRVYPTKRVKGFTHTYIEHDGTLEATLHAQH